MKELLVVRHCESSGQAPDAPLTERGLAQATALANALPIDCVDRIISSPYMRAIQSITPFANRSGLRIELDDRLRERSLCAPASEDWRAALERSYADLDLSFPGGESARAAMMRGVGVVNDITGAAKVMLVTHGNLMALLLRSFDDSVGFAFWQQIRNPDAYRVTFDANGSCEGYERVPVLLE